MQVGTSLLSGASRAILSLLFWQEGTMKIFHQQFCTELILQTSFCALETPREIVAAMLHRVPGGCRAQQLLLPPAVTRSSVPVGWGLAPHLPQGNVKPQGLAVGFALGKHTQICG